LIRRADMGATDMIGPGGEVIGQAKFVDLAPVDE